MIDFISFLAILHETEFLNLNMHLILQFTEKIIQSINEKKLANL